MRTILVSLMSRHTLPNLLLIKDQKFSVIDEYLFISTAATEQEKHLDALTQAAQIPRKKYRNLVVDHADPNKIHEVLEKEIRDLNVNFKINLTGGTKMMALAAHSFFKENAKNSQFFYLPYPLNDFIQIKFGQATEEMKLSHQLSLNEFLTAYQVTVRAWRMHELSGFIAPKELLFSGNFPEGNLNYSEKMYYKTGGWFEEYCFLEFKSALKLNEGKIATNVQILKKNIDREIDVLFMHKNQIHVVECKTGLKRDKKNDIVKETINKLKVVKDLTGGLEVKGYLCTLVKLKAEEKKKAKDLNITVIEIDKSFRTKKEKMRNTILSLINP